MVGNHCLKVLANYEVLTSDENLHQKFKELFSIFNAIRSLSMCNRFLKMEEMLTLTERCAEFGQRFPIYFAQRNIIPKIQIGFQYSFICAETQHNRNVVRTEGESNQASKR